MAKSCDSAVKDLIGSKSTVDSVHGHKGPGQTLGDKACRRGRCPEPTTSTASRMHKSNRFDLSKELAAEKPWKKSKALEYLHSLPLKDPTSHTGNDETETRYRLPRDSIFTYGIVAGKEKQVHYFICNICKQFLKSHQVGQHMLAEHAHQKPTPDTAPRNSSSNTTTTSSSVNSTTKSKKNRYKDKKKGTATTLPLPPLFPWNEIPASAKSVSSANYSGKKEDKTATPAAAVMFTSSILVPVEKALNKISLEKPTNDVPASGNVHDELKPKSDHPKTDHSRQEHTKSEHGKLEHSKTDHGKSDHSKAEHRSDHGKSDHSHSSHRTSKSHSKSSSSSSNNVSSNSKDKDREDDKEGSSSKSNSSKSHSSSRSRSSRTSAKDHSKSSSKASSKSKPKSEKASATSSLRSRQRKSKPLPYNPDTHCGVLDSQNIKKGPCLRSVTCAIHQIMERRAVKGRSKPVDDLIAEYKASRTKPVGRPAAYAMIAPKIRPLQILKDINGIRSIEVLETDLHNALASLENVRLETAQNNSTGKNSEEKCTPHTAPLLSPPTNTSGTYLRIRIDSEKVERQKICDLVLDTSVMHTHPKPLIVPISCLKRVGYSYVLHNAQRLERQRQDIKEALEKRNVTVLNNVNKTPVTLNSSSNRQSLLKNNIKATFKTNSLKRPSIDKLITSDSKVIKVISSDINGFVLTEIDGVDGLQMNNSNHET